MKLSIVTPSFNQGRFVERTLHSVAIQRDTGVKVEHLVFDGGSDDGTVAILGRFDPRVAWQSGPDDGQADAVNRGFGAASGDVIGWLNSDDVYHPGALATVARFLDEHPAVDVVYGMADHVDVDDRVIEPYPTEPWNLERLRQTCFICQPALFMRRRVVETCGVLDASLVYCMDYEYWLRLGRAGVRFAYLPVKLASSRMYPGNKTLGARVKVHAEINDMQRRLFGSVPESWLFAYAHAVVESKGSGSGRRRLFALRVGISAVFAALRWNRAISGAMIAIVCRHIQRTMRHAIAVKVSRQGGD